MIPDLAAATRVLVRLPNWLGDALMARPFMGALRRAAPRARVTAWGPAPLLELLGTDGAFDETVPLPGSPRGAGDAFELAYVLPPSFSSAWRARRAGARARVGFAGEGRSPLLTHALRRTARGERHLASEYLSLLGLESVPHAPPLPVPDVAAHAAAERLAAAGLAGRPFAILAPGAAYGPAKRWPLERFSALAERLEAGGLALLACGGAQDRAACDALADAKAGARLSTAGRTTLPEQAALCSAAELVVSNDSGLAHLAAAVGTPTLVLFGSTSSAWTAPLGPAVRIVQHAPVCSPCFQRTCRIGYRCLTAIAVGEVAAAATAARAGRGERGA